MAATPDWIEGQHNPYLEGAFAPIDGEIDASGLPVTGALPRELEGLFVRNGPNPTLAPRGRHHWFDGDGMLHGVELREGRARYVNRYVRTPGRDAEQRAGRALWPGYMDPPDPEAPPGSGSDGWLKDTANTDVVFHAGHLLALWYQCGVPVRIDPRSLASLGPESFGGDLPRRVSAHAKADERTGELLFFDYATQAPYLAYHVADAGGKLVHSTAIDLPGPRLPHDMAFTERFAILMDLPLFWDEALLARGVHKLRFHRDVPSRFAVLPRRGSEVRWFEAEPTYIYHVVNAWEEGDEIVLDAFRVVDPLPPGNPADGPLARMLAVLRLDARLHRWRFDLRTGATREEPLGELNTEFPTIDSARQGVATRYAYSPRIAAGEKTLLFDAIVKYDTRTGRTWTHELGPGRFASEAPFAARPGARDEDDGWLVSFVHDAGRDRSELWVLDARDLAAPPVARVALPQRVPIGFHACWVGADRLGKALRVAQV